jgi:hypothetical protein
MVKPQDTDRLSAQVILRPEIAAARQGVSDWFRQAGFIVGPLVGNNFSIAAQAAAFKSYFGVDLTGTPQSGVKVLGAEGAAALELPVDMLPTAIRDKVEAVLFTKPPDFGLGGRF